ncbi:hypothetical protein BIS09_13500 [Halomonas sp. R1t8]|uniref:hypothetical protein n=1 Tax=unclassified Halomonas TaxID=2609666 RepID=UPI00209CF89B|nr:MULTISPECIES: hypothetical protein [unclassified Halomonas]MCP1304848.1 hypothetical protein [Halomonas sp. R1t8]MCP1331844.1 hypothetical protein [Halomonas sp. R1t4]
MTYDFTALWGVHTGNQAQQRGFTRAVGTNQPHAHPRGDREVDVFEHPVATVVVVVAFVEVVYFDHLVVVADGVSMRFGGVSTFRGVKGRRA